MAPIVAAIVGSFGYGEGQQLLAARDIRWEVTVADGDKKTTYQVAGVRRFDSVVIVVDLQKQVVLYPASSVVSAKHVAAHDFGVLNGCRWFGVLCTVGSQPENKPEAKTSNTSTHKTPVSVPP